MSLQHQKDVFKHQISANQLNQNQVNASILMDTQSQSNSKLHQKAEITNKLTQSKNESLIQQNLQQQIQISLICEDRLTSKKCLFPQLKVELFNNQYINIFNTLNSSLIVKSFLQGHLIFIEREEIDISLGLFPYEMDQKQKIQLNLSEKIELKIKHQQVDLNIFSPKISIENSPSTIINDIKQNKKCDDQNYEKKYFFDDINEQIQEKFIETEDDDDDEENDNFDGDEIQRKNTQILNKSIKKDKNDQNLISPKQKNIQKLNGETIQKTYIQEYKKMDNPPKRLRRQSLNKRSHERTICESIQLVTKWRDHHELCKSQNQVKDLQDVAQDMGISKKTLDYYYLELRTAEYFNFDFDSHLNERMGFLRQFIEEQTKIYQENNKQAKIPRQLNFKYKLPCNYSDQNHNIKQNISLSSNNLDSSQSQNIIHNLNQIQNLNFQQNVLYNSTNILSQQINSFKYFDQINTGNNQPNNISLNNSTSTFSAQLSIQNQEDNFSKLPIHSLNNSQIELNQNQSNNLKKNITNSKIIKTFISNELDNTEQQLYLDQSINQNTKSEENRVILSLQSQQNPNMQKEEIIPFKKQIVPLNCSIESTQFNILKQQLQPAQQDQQSEQQSENNNPEIIHPYEEKQNNKFYQQFLQKQKLIKQEEMFSDTMHNLQNIFE